MSHYTIDGFRDSLWNHTAVKAPECLQGNVGFGGQFDVAIIGAGFTGLNAAIELQLAGLNVCVVEAEQVGYGASGRAGGQVNMGMNLNPSELIKKYGVDQGERTIDMVRQTPSRVFDRINKLQLDCDASQTGWVQAAVNSKVRQQQSSVVADYEKFGGGLEILSKPEMEALSGSKAYEGGMLCPTAGTLHPLSYTRELARYAISQGVRIFEKIRARELKRTSDGWQVVIGSKFASAPVLNAGQVLVCTNGYTDDLIKDLKQKLIPVRSILMATEPLSEKMRQEVLPNQLSFVDKRRLIIYMRYDRDGRLCVGDHGPMRDKFCLEDYIDVKKRAVEIFPTLKQIRWDYHWGGRIAMTRDHLPFIAEPADGIFVGMGYNGRGVGLGTMMGINLAKAVVAKHKSLPVNDLDLPISKPKSYPFHSFHKLGVKVGIAHAKFRDAWEQRSAN